jgi:glycosyltransferase involved in cell wall biosynthesis
MVNPLRRGRSVLGGAIRRAAGTADLQAQINLLKSRLDCDPGLFHQLEAERRTAAYAERYAKPDPLVSICVTTYNRAELLCGRALKSLIGQTYRNIEIIVVGDACSDDTEERVAAIGDGRISFVNLPERGNYPEEPRRRWSVAGTKPFNVALTLANGDFITHLDDDDRHSPDRIEKLLRFSQEKRLEFVFHPFAVENSDGTWSTNEAATFDMARVTSSSIFYDRFFKRVPLDIDAHLLGEPGDWNRLRKFPYLGARIGRCPEVLLQHFRERNQRSA